MWSTGHEALATGQLGGPASELAYRVDRCYEGRGYIPTGRTNQMRGAAIYLQGGPASSSPIRRFRAVALNLRDRPYPIPTRLPVGWPCP
eukprot:984228-Prorocentrum_minimum.AAC.1